MADPAIEPPGQSGATADRPAIASTFAGEQPPSHSNAESAEDPAGEPETRQPFWHRLRRQMIDWGSMTTPLRLVTGVAIAQLLAAAALLYLKTLPVQLARVPLEFSATSIAWPAFLICVVATMLAWSFIVTGALYMDIRVRLVIGGIFSWWVLLVPATSIYGILVGVAAAFWLLAGAVSVAQWRLPAHTGTVGLVWWARPPLTFAVVFCLQVLLCAVYVRAMGALAGNVVTLELVSLAYLVGPVVFLAGSDFAELSEQAADSVADAIDGMRRWWRHLVGTAVVAAFALGSALWVEMSAPHRHSGLSVVAGLVVQILVGSALVAGALWAARWARAGGWSPATRLSHWALLAAVLLYLGVVMLIILTQTFLRWPPAPPATVYVIYKHPAAAQYPAFSLAYPSTWRVDYAVDQGAGTTLVRFVIKDSDQSVNLPPWANVDLGGEFYVFTLPTARLTPNDLQDFPDYLTRYLLADRCRGPCQWTLAPPYHGWTTANYAAPDGSEHGTTWIRRVRDRVWVLIGGAPGQEAHVLAGSYHQMVESWRPDLSAEVPVMPQTTAGVLQSLLGQLALMACAGAAGLALMKRYRRRGGPLAGAGLFLIVFGLVEAAYALYNALSLLPVTLVLGGQPLTGLRVATAIGTLGVVGWLAWRRWRHLPLRDAGVLLRALLVLNGGLLVLSWILGLYDQAKAAGEVFNAGQAIVLVIALGWDLLMSGEQITNHDSPRFPRPARVLLYCGYIMLIAVLVLYFSSQTYSKTSVTVPALFDSEGFAQGGLLVLGVPVLLFGFILAGARWLSPHRD